MVLWGLLLKTHWTHFIKVDFCNHMYLNMFTLWTPVMQQINVMGNNMNAYTFQAHSKGFIQTLTYNK